MPVIEMSGVSHAYGDRVVLADVDLQLTEQRIAVIGGNGSGKSTFARLINGLVRPTAGSVQVDGLDVHRHARQVRTKVGFCFTNPDAQIVMPTVAEDVAFGLRRMRLTKDDVARRVQRVLVEYGLAHLADHPAHLLSGGQKQLLALASVLVTEPEILVMDEPTTLLDLRNSAAVASALTRLPQQIVLVTHHLDLIASYDRVLVVEAGRVAYDGAPDEAVSFYRKVVMA